MRGQPAGDAKADHATIALPDGAFRDRFQLAAGSAADHLDARRLGDFRFEGQADESDNQTTVRFDDC